DRPARPRTKAIRRTRTTAQKTPAAGAPRAPPVAPRWTPRAPPARPPTRPPARRATPPRRARARREPRPRTREIRRTTTGTKPKRRAEAAMQARARTPETGEARTRPPPARADVLARSMRRPCAAPADACGSVWRGSLCDAFAREGAVPRHDSRRRRSPFARQSNDLRQLLARDLTILQQRCGPSRDLGRRAKEVLGRCPRSPRLQPHHHGPHRGRDEPLRLDQGGETLQRVSGSAGRTCHRGAGRLVRPTRSPRRDHDQEPRAPRLSRRPRCEQHPRTLDALDVGLPAPNEQQD